ncbi:hypothetical protein R3P38DRAFT_2805935 [Favolaschia claudopus]|uniref:Uncharacterized protein n=1 Tax=Favolaschia claudopus TaxID=2862362 RepID=A0AAV9ZLR4_9AGAR
MRLPATIPKNSSAYRGPILFHSDGPGGSGVDMMLVGASIPRVITHARRESSAIERKQKNLESINIETKFIGRLSDSVCSELPGCGWDPQLQPLEADVFCGLQKAPVRFGPGSNSVIQTTNSEDLGSLWAKELREVHWLHTIHTDGRELVGKSQKQTFFEESAQHMMNFGNGWSRGTATSSAQSLELVSDYRVRTISSNETRGNMSRKAEKSQDIARDQFRITTGTEENLETAAVHQRVASQEYREQKHTAGEKTSPIRNRGTWAFGKKNSTRSGPWRINLLGGTRFLEKPLP